MEKLNMQTTNVVDENIKRIGELFPNCLTERLNEKGQPETAIDFDQLRQESRQRPSSRQLRADIRAL